MSPEEKELLKRSIALAEENNDILRGIQRSMRLARLMTVLYWLILLVAAIGAYYVFQPYIQEGMSLYNKAKSTIDGASTGVNNVINGFKK